MKAIEVLGAEQKRIPYWTGVISACLLACLVYFNALENPFHYDDFHSIVDNENIRSIGAIPSFFVTPSAFSSQPENAMYRPLLLSSFALNYAISGYSPWSYHVVSLALHCVCIVLLAAIAQRAMGKTWGMWLAVVLFAIHPINSECINYISSRSEILAALFFLLGFWAYLKTEWDVNWRLILICIAYICALMSKSIAIVLPVVMATFDLAHGRSIRGQARAYMAMGLIGGLYIVGIWRFLARAAVGDPVRPFSEQFWTQVKAQVFYIKMLLWPSGQNVDHQFLISDTLFDPIVAAALLLLVSLAVMVWLYRRRFPLPLAFFLWFFIVIAPSSLIPLNVLVNEHRLYLPSAAFFMAVGFGYDRLAPVLGRRQWLSGLIAVAVVAGLSLATVQRNKVWASSLSLWRSAATAAPLMARPSIYMGDAYEHIGQIKQAVDAYEHALSRDPNFPPLHLRLGRMLLQAGESDRALALLARGTELDPENGSMWGARAEAHGEKEQWQESLVAYMRAVTLEPEDDVLHNNLGNTYQMLGLPDKALDHHLRALQLNPIDPRTLVNMGNAYRMLGQFEQALAAYSRAVRSSPDYAGAWLSYASALELTGAREKAVEAYERAGQLDPSYRQYVAKRIKNLQEVRRD
jgi:tetratricopeptide (TPR) repeat protein